MLGISRITKDRHGDYHAWFPHAVRILNEEVAVAGEDALVAHNGAEGMIVMLSEVVQRPDVVFFVRDRRGQLTAYLDEALAKGAGGEMLRVEVVHAAV